MGRGARAAPPHRGKPDNSSVLSFISLISATFLLFNHASGVSLAPLSSACLLLCSEWNFAFSSLAFFQSGAEQGGDQGHDIENVVGMDGSALSPWQREIVPTVFTKAFFFCQRTCVTGSLCGGVMGSLDVLGRLDSVAMGINV